MEQDDRDYREELLRRDDSSTDPENDFESYLNRKVEGCSKPIPTSQMEELTTYPGITIPLIDAEKSAYQAALDAAADSFGDPSLSGDNGASSSTTLARDVVNEQKTELAIRGTEGHRYVAETSEAIPVDPESIRIMELTYKAPEKTIEILVEEVLKKIFTTRFDTLKATPEQVITHYHGLDKAVGLIRMMQQGQRTKLFEMLQEESAERRVMLLEMDSKFKVTSRKREGKSPKAAPSKSSTTGLTTKQRKAVETLMSLGASKDMILNKLKTMDMLNDVAEAYVAKLFA